MGWRETPPDPPDYGDYPPCPNCHAPLGESLPVDEVWVNDEYESVIHEVKWECSECHHQYWAEFRRE